MNQKLKFQLVALMAVLSGTALGNCQAMQADANPPNAVGSGVIRPAEPDDGAFGAVTSARPIENYGAVGELPPIISPAYAAAESSEQMVVTLPPVVTPSKTKETLNTPVQTVPAKTSSMLAPLAPQQPAALPAIEAPTFEAPTFEAPTFETPAFETPAFETPAFETSAVEAPEFETSEFESPESQTALPYTPAPVIQATGAPVDVENDQLVEQATQWNPQNMKVSAAGVPLYPQASAASFTTPQEIPPIVQGSLEPPASYVPPVNPMPPVVNAESQMISPISVDPYAPSDTNQSYFSAPPMEAPVISSGCDSCGGGGCSDCGVAASAGGDLCGCQSCGPGGCFNEQQVADRFDACGSVYEARGYLLLDVMYFDRYDGKIAMSNFGGLNDYQERGGLRVTIGRREDATRGAEFTYMGTDTLRQYQTVADAGGRISLGLANTGGFAVTEMTAFRDAVEQNQGKETMFHSIEFNRVQWGWDVVKSFIGIRYIYVQDEYSVASRNLGGETGVFGIRTLNNQFGLNLGNEWFYDVGYRLSFSAGSKWGVYVNPSKVETSLLNDGVQFLDLGDYNTTVGGSIELNVNGKYQISRNVRFRFGYTGLYLGRVAGVSDNIPSSLSPTTGSDTSDTGEMYFQALSLGFEIYR